MAKPSNKKTDYGALHSPFMRVPRMKVEVARSLLDLGLTQLYELEGRSPESLWEAIRAQKADTPPDQLPYLRMLVYYAENPDPERGKLHPSVWK